jgi:hypothetical protein
VKGLDKEAFWADKHTQKSVIMNLIIIGEAATKVMDGYAEFNGYTSKCLGAAYAIVWPTIISILTMKWFERQYKKTTYIT